MNKNLTDIILGTPFLDDLPESARRAYNIISNSSVPTQNLEEIATYIWNRINKVKIISIFTGFYCKSGFETDGPVGALILAEFFLKNKIPVQICCEKELLKIMKSIIIELSLSNSPLITPFENINNLKDSMVFTIERPGENIKKICHTMDGFKISHSILPIESEINKNLPIAWIAIGDGGNELGTGYYRKTIEKLIPYGKNCNCGCEGGITAYKEANRCILSVTSNFGAILLSLELAKQKKIKWSVPADKVTQIIRHLNKHGIKDGVTGKKGTVDGISIDLRKKMYDLVNSLF